MNENSMSSRPKDSWASGDAYEPYVGRWSRLVAREFLNWLSIPAKARWLDVGCGTGALSQTILQFANPVSINGIDRSEDYVNFAREHTQDSRAQFEVEDAEKLTYDSGSFDATVSGLVLNFLPHPDHAVAEMTRVTRTGGMVAAYVWDYADRMQLMRHFWDAATALDPGALELDEGRRFPLCQPDALSKLFKSARLDNVEVQSIEVSTNFRDFDDYWSPFLGGQGPAPSYLMSLNEEARVRLREQIRDRLPFASDGSIPLVARAWAVRGVQLGL